MVYVDPLAPDARIVEVSNDAVGDLGGKRHAGVQPPCAFVVAAGALVNAAGNEQGAAGARTVNNIYRVVLMVIHFSLLN